MELVEIKKVFTQEADCCSPSDMWPSTISVEIQDGGGGPYIVIQTERWALSDNIEIDSFAKTLKSILREAEKRKS